MKKIANRPITKADTDFSKMSTKKLIKKNRILMNFEILWAHTLAL